MKKVGLVLEGGAMRGLYTAGVLDVLMDNNIQFDGIIGVSAGALFGVNYLSKQRGRALRYNLKYAHDLRYISVLSLLLTGNVVNKKFAYYKVSNKLDKFDDETFKNSKIPFYVTITNMETGLPEYPRINSCLEEMELLRATSAMPLFSRPVDLNGKYYLDGAVSDSIPVMKMKELGYDKLVLVLTRDIDYKKSDIKLSNVKRIEKKYKKYPNFIKKMIDRPSNYNKTLDIIKELESKGEILVIRPSKPININAIERNKDILKSVYDLGVKDINDNLDNVKKYIKKK